MAAPHTALAGGGVGLFCPGAASLRHAGTCAWQGCCGQ